jgi:hypothetical protein
MLFRAQAEIKNTMASASKMEATPPSENETRSLNRALNKKITRDNTSRKPEVKNMGHLSTPANCRVHARIHT